MFFYDYLLTLQAEASELLVTTPNYTLTSDVGPICVGRKEVTE